MVHVCFVNLLKSNVIFLTVNKYIQRDNSKLKRNKKGKTKVYLTNDVWEIDRWVFFYDVHTNDFADWSCQAIESRWVVCNEMLTNAGQSAQALRLCPIGVESETKGETKINYKLPQLSLTTGQEIKK